MIIGRSGATVLLAGVVWWVAAACGSDATEVSSGDPVDGQALYAQHCASCHGSDLRGTVQGPSQLSVVYEPGHHSDASYVAAITGGVRAHHWNFGDMPPVAGLNPDEVDAIISFIRGRQQAEGFDPYPTP